MQQFEPQLLKNLYTPPENSNGEDNGLVTIIGGSKLFHGAPILSLKAASKIVDMVFFASPEESMREVSAYIKASVSSFIWVPWDEVEKYIEKSDAVLIGNGLMRYSSEHYVPEDKEYDDVANATRHITKELLHKYQNKKWVIDAGSLQTMDPEWIPANAILTPNNKEYECLFGDMPTEEAVQKYNCIIVRKGAESVVYAPGKEPIVIKGGNGGMTKGGTGDVLAGVTVGLLAKNDPFLAACAASFITKKTGEKLAESVGHYYSSEDLAESINYF